MKKENFTFIDLFAGIGGFNQALSSIGGNCVFASEIDEECKKTYENQFKIKVNGDINECINKIPKFDMLCAGFPCQSFSKAGLQEGFSNKEKGKLFYRIIDILKKHPECKYIILENVRNLADQKKFWDVIQKELNQIDFYITKNPIILSPDYFGIPQNRERVYILGIKKSVCNKKIKEKKEITYEDLDLKSFRKKCRDGDAYSILANEKDNINYVINDEERNVIEAWEEFKMTILPNKQIGTPIWLDYFDIPYKKNRLYIKEKDPKWKKNFINRNLKFYKENRKKINKWYTKYKDVLSKSTYRKFEWNCGPDYYNFKKCIIQFRQSGLRIKKADKFPSLVAIVNTPIIWDNKLNVYRRITIRESANLQSFQRGYKFISPINQVYKQLGNSVNVRVIKRIATQLLGLSK